MSTIITELLGTDSKSQSRVDINANFANRHSFDITEIDDTDSPYTVLETDQFVIVDASAAAVTVALPASATFPNRSLVVVAKSVAGGNVTINPDGAETVNGASTKVLSAAYASSRITCDGSEWYAT